MRTVRCLLALLIALNVLGVASPAMAQPAAMPPASGPTAPQVTASISVTTPFDEWNDTNNGLCSLREALERVYNNVFERGCPKVATGATTFFIDLPSGTYKLTEQIHLPDLGPGVTININSDATIDGGAPGRNLGILRVVGANLNLKKLTFTKGVREFGGALTMGAGVVTLDDVKFINNGAVTGPVITQEGGAVNVSSGMLYSYSTLFQGNKAKKGGAVSTKFGLFDDATFINNQAEVGGALFIWDNTVDPVVVQKSKFLDNKSINPTGPIVPEKNDHMGGGAIANNGNLKVVSTLIKNNKTEKVKGGAGLWNDAGATALLEECVFTQNNAPPSGAGSTFGGAIFNEGTLDLVRCSIHGNEAKYAAGIFNRGGADLNSYNTTIANNTAQNLHGGLANEINFFDTNHNGGAQVHLWHTTIAGNKSGFGDGPGFNHLHVEEDYSVWLSNSIVDTPCNSALYTYGRSIVAGMCTTVIDPQNGLITATDFVSTGVAAIQLQGLTNGNAVGGVAEYKVMKIGNGVAVDVGRNGFYGCDNPLIAHKDQNLAARSPICDAGAFEAGTNPPSFSSDPAPGFIMMDPVDLTQSGERTFVDLKLENTGGGAMTYEVFQGFPYSPFVTAEGPNAGNLFTGQSVTKRFYCEPTAVGEHIAEVVIETNAPNKQTAQFTFLCVGSGQDPQVTTSPPPGPENLPPAEPGNTAQTDLTLQNDGHEQLTGQATLKDDDPAWGGTATSGPQGAEFIQGPDGPAAPINFSLNPGQSVDFHITCTPPGPGLFTNTWRIISNDPEHPLIEIPLACEGIVLSPPESIVGAGFSDSSPLPTRDVAISPEGGNLVAAGDGSDDVRVYNRTAGTGALTFFGSYPGEPGMTNINAIEYSRDGKHVYYTSRTGDGIVVLNRTGGILTHGIVITRSTLYLCGGIMLYCPVNSMDGAEGLAVSPDDQFVYVAGAVDGTLTVLRRNTATDLLQFTQRITRTAGTGVNVLGGASRVAVSPDGQHIYVVSDVDDTVAVFQRMVNGRLTFQGAYEDGMPGLSNLNYPSDVVVSPDGNFVYVSAYNDSAINVFRRDSADGLLTLTSVVTDVVDGWGLAITSDPAGERLFLGQTAGNKVEAYARDEITGALTRINTLTHNTPPGSNIFEPWFMAVSPDNAYLYAALYGGEGVRQFSTVRHPPVVTFISPASAVFGGPDFELTVRGGAFYPDTKIVWADSPLFTVFVSENELRATVPAAYIAAVGTHDVLARTTVPGGGDSAPVEFAVLSAAAPPIPSIASLEPPEAEFGSEDLLVVVHGANFSWDTQATYNGQPVPTVFFEHHTLEIYLSAALLTEPGTGGVQVTNNPSPDAASLDSSPAAPGPSSGIAGFHVAEPGEAAAPSAASLAPASVVSGSLGIWISVLGHNFSTDPSASSVGRWNGQARATVVLNENELLMQLTDADLDQAGDQKVSVLTPGTGESPYLTFRVRLPGEKPVPVLNNVRVSFSPGAVLYVNGSDFEPTSQVYINGVARATTVINNTTLTVALTVADVAGVVHVTNPGPGGGTSGTKNFRLNRLWLPVALR